MLAGLLIVIKFLVTVSYANLSTLADNIFVIASDDSEVLIDRVTQDSIYSPDFIQLLSLYVTFDYLNNGALNLTDTMHRYNEANIFSQYPTQSQVRFFLSKYHLVTSEELIKGVILTSAPDATSTLSSYINTDTNIFAEIMNFYSHKLAMHNTYISNDIGKVSYTNIRDLVRLARRLYMDFPQYYHYFRTNTLSMHSVTHANNNLLINETNLPNNVSVDGLKSGIINRNESAILFGAFNDNMRIFGMVSGSYSPQRRYIETRKVVNYVFNNYRKHVLYNKGDLITSIVLLNNPKDYYDIIAQENIYVILHKSYNVKDIKIDIVKPKYLINKVNEGDHMANISIIVGNETIKSYTIFAQTSLEGYGIFKSVLVRPYYALKAIILDFGY